MAWWLCREYSYAGSGFDWINPDSVEEKRSLVGGGLSLSQGICSRNVPTAAHCDGLN